jgi:hypothetical protein
MEKHTLKIYDTEATIYEMSFKEVEEGSVRIEGVPSLAEAEQILSDRQYKEVKNRKFSSYVAKGFAPTKHTLVVADNINQKQLANILVTIGMIDGIAYEADIDAVSVEEIKEEDVVAEVAAASAEIAKEKDEKKRK